MKEVEETIGSIRLATPVGGACGID